MKGLKLKFIGKDSNIIKKILLGFDFSDSILYKLFRDL